MVDTLDISQVAHQLGVSRRKVVRLIADGELPPVTPSVLDHRRKLLPREAVDQLAARERGPVTTKKEATRVA